jgi:hypothetical protein
MADQFVTAEQRAAILREARANVAGPRYQPQAYTEPAVPDRVTTWRREAEELAAQREAAQLTDCIATRVMDNLRAEFEGKLAYQKQFIFDVVAGVVNEIKMEIDEQVGQLRAEVNVADKALNAKVIDLPNPLLTRRAG